MGHGAQDNTVHAAWMPLNKGCDPDRSTIRYYCGRDCAETWSNREADAKNLFSTIGYTNLSLSWIPAAKRWLLLYSLASPGALGCPMPKVLDPDTTPTGRSSRVSGLLLWDWSDEIIIFDPLRDNALGRFMHRPCDELNYVPPFLPPDYDLAYGGEPSYVYGPFPLNRYTKWDPSGGELTIYYLMSTLRPYQVQLMCSRFEVHPPGS